MRKSVLIAVLASRYLSPAGDPDRLSGYWVTDFERSKFAAGFPALKHQSLDCDGHGNRLRCVAVRISAAGIRTQMTFAARYDGREYPVTGSDDVTGVMLRRLGSDRVDATFVRGRQTVLGYELRVSGDGHVLTIRSVDAASRRGLTSVVVYRRK